MKHKFLLALLSSIFVLPVATVQAQTENNGLDFSSYSEGTRVSAFVALSNAKTVVMNADRQVIAVIVEDKGNPYGLLPGVLYEADAVFYETAVELRNIVRSSNSNAAEFLEIAANVDPSTAPSGTVRDAVIPGPFPLEYPEAPWIEEPDSGVTRPIVSPDA
jgi:hypothetical protein